MHQKVKAWGDQFLRHVERTAVLLHMIDVYSDDPAEKYQAIRRELEKYSESLAERPEIIALTNAKAWMMRLLLCSRLPFKK